MACYSSCLDGYLCPECASCTFWRNDANSVGCWRPFERCDAFDRVFACEEIMNSQSRRVTSTKHGAGTALKFDKTAVRNTMLIAFDNGTKAWVDVTTLRRISDE